MKLHFFAYSISTALNRASQFLFLPLATQVMSLGEFGKYSLALALAQLSFPFFCANGQEAITREGAANHSLGLRILNKFFLYTLLCIAVLCLALIVPMPLPSWLTFGLALGACEASHQLLFSYFRITDSYRTYFSFGLIKAVGTGLSILLFWGHPSPLTLILATQLAIYALLSLWIFQINSFHFRWPLTQIKSYLPYSLFLLPAGISQWVISSSDRFIVHWFWQEQEVGVYSIAYNIALVLMVINSGAALSIPQNLFKNPSQWLSPLYRTSFLTKLAALGIFCYFSLLTATLVDLHYLKLVKNLNTDHLSMIVWVGVGMLSLVFYYIPANIILYKKRPGLLTLITIATALINISLTALLTYQLKSLGAAIATGISYLVFTAATIVTAQTLEPKYSSGLKEWCLFFITIVLSLMPLILITGF